MSEFDHALKLFGQSNGYYFFQNTVSPSADDAFWQANHSYLKVQPGPHNPHTFAAAPMMLEALRALAKSADEYVNTGSDRSGIAAMVFNLRRDLNVAHAAIAAAEGDDDA